MTDSSGVADRSDDYCYRHPDRQSFVLCQRCARTVCAECQTEAPVGVICPECMHASAAAGAGSARGMRVLPARRPRGGNRFGRMRPASSDSVWRRLFGGDSPVTYAIIAITTIAGIAQVISSTVGNDWVTLAGAYSGQYTDLRHENAAGNLAFEPWRMLTSAFLHLGLLHYLFNMLSAWIFGRALEPVIGSLRFGVLYVVSALGGSLAVALINPNAWVVGASGAIFGLFAAWFVVLRTSGQDTTSMLILIGLNVAVSFTNPGVSWEAHIGGLVLGLACGALTVQDLRSEKQPARGGLWGQIALGVVCLAVPPLVGTLLY